MPLSYRGYHRAGSTTIPCLHCITLMSPIPSPLSEGNTLNLYADDVLLYKQVRSPEDFRDLQSDIDCISDWVRSNNFTLIPNKCKAMMISRKRNTIQPPQLILNGTYLEQVETFKYL